MGTQLPLEVRAPDKSASVVVRRNRVMGPQRHLRDVVGQKFSDKLWLQAVFMVAEPELAVQVAPPGVHSACLRQSSRVVLGSGHAQDVDTFESENREGSTSRRGNPVQGVLGMAELSRCPQAAALSEAGRVYTWGSNLYGQ